MLSFDKIKAEKEKFCSDKIFDVNDDNISWSYKTISFDIV